MKRVGEDELRSANRTEYEETVKVVSENQDVVGIFSLPVANDRSIPLYEVAQLMENGFAGLKMTATKGMSDHDFLMAAYCKITPEEFKTNSKEVLITKARTVLCDMAVRKLMIRCADVAQK